jgi:hypothetical protein
MSDNLRNAINRKIAALKAEAAKLTGELLREDKAIASAQLAQSELAAKLARSSNRRHEIQDGLARLFDQISEEESSQ